MEISYMKIEKLDEKVFNQKIDEVTASLGSLKLGIRSALARIISTDNFLEKYQPFQFINLIQDFMSCIFTDKLIPENGPGALESV